MKLIDFKKHTSFNNLRVKMKAEYIEWSADSSWEHFDPFKFREKLRSDKEVEIPFQEIQTSDDNSLELYGEKILVYIRDQRSYGHGVSNHKFHIANCQTLKGAQRNNKYDKYVASINTDGKFKVNIIHGQNWVEEKEVEMMVCLNCLKALNYKGYNDINKWNRNEIYENFNIKEFFDSYKKPDIQKTKYTSINKPINQYTDNFHIIANKLKKEKKWTCEECGYNREKKFLHVHHINSNKFDNNRKNLKVLCVKCHAEQYQHEHMKRLKSYKEFMRIR